MQDEVDRLRAKIAKLEEVLEKQRWTAREQAIRYDQSTTRLERSLEDKAFSEEYQKEQVARYKSVLDSMSEAVLIMEKSGRLLLFNRAAELLLQPAKAVTVPVGSDANDPVNTRESGPSELTEINIALDTTALIRALSGEHVNDFACQTTVYGVEKMLSVNARPLLTEDGKIWGSVAVIRIV